jgi:hypothetical protein
MEGHKDYNGIFQLLRLFAFGTYLDYKGEVIVQRDGETTKLNGGSKAIPALFRTSRPTT